ncbi:efflux RND transporter permease subunit [Sporomusa sp.]|uniref:efflux RND transporter permease subunit n=1 Tax=Sporomusa sp. TaxID=2078658 RepID=UPI002B633BA2|nr:efflux RND transporter permease subunit [Sporomusa sp.]HWR05499.1 efflux RND transporter permease subunit [Sporomusa sp.]
MIDVFIRRPVFTTMLVMLLVVFGLTSYPGLGVDLYPDVEFPLVMASVTYTGASPEEMESLITKPIEDAVSSVAGIKTLSSVSREGVSQTTIEFELGTNPKMAANDVREKVAGVRRRLPEQIDEPVVQRFDITAQSILTFSLASDVRQRGEIRKIAEDIVKDQIQQLEGVAEVSVYGAAQREIQILADPRKLEAYGLSLQQLLDVVNNNNINTPGGRVTEKGIELTVRTIGKYESVDDIRNIIVLNQEGRLVRLQDVASVQDTWAEERTYAATNGVPSVIVSIQKQSGTNTVGVAEKVKQSMQQLEQNVLPPDIKVTKVRDNATYIRDSVDDVMVSMVFGGLLAVAITFLFLRNTRATVIGAIAIPTSIISTFFLMKVMNFTLNNMSLMGLSLAVGILIDDAIVIVENIFRHMEDGKSPMAAAREGTKEISLAVLATTFSILAVFVPVGNMGEIIGQYFKQFGLTVAFAVAFSLFVAFTLTPMLSAYWLKTGHDAAGRRLRWLEALLDKWEHGFESLRETYRQILYWALQRPRKLVALALLSLFLNALLLPFLGSEFQPTYDSGEFNINVMAPAGTSIERSKELMAQVEKEVMAIPELESAYMVVGTNRQVYRSMVGIRLVDSSKRSRSMMQIMDSLRVQFRNVKGLKVSVSTGQSQGRGDSRPIQVALRGPELDTLNQYANTLAEKIKQIPGTTDVDISSEQSEPEVQVKFDPNRLGDVGLDATAAGKAVQIAFLGSTAKNQYNVADSDYDIRVQLKQENRLSLEDVANLRISGQHGFIRLGDIAEVKLSSGPTQIDREDRQRQVIVYANAVGTSPGEVIAKVKEFIPGLNLPMGYTHKLVGQAQMMESSFNEITKALVLAVVLIYMVLAAEFESFIHPLTIMLSLPFSLVGAVLGLLIAGNTINIMSLIGVIMLMGLVTKNAILLVDYANQQREQGVPIIDALVEAGSVRLRPILMTTMAMIFGMLPIALGIGAGAEIRSSMGVALIGGLITSTFLTLVIIPLVYLLIDKMQNYFREEKTDLTEKNPGV